MRTLMTITRHGGPDVFDAVAAPAILPLPGDVRVRTRAIGINFADVWARMGLYEAAPRPPFVPGFEFAGGAYATSVQVPANRVFPIPDGVPFEEAAGFPAVFATAHHAIHRLGRLEAGQIVLIHAAAGGVGMAAIQLARQAGARILATCGSSRKVEVIKSWGVDEVFDYSGGDFAPWVRARAGARGVDLILDSLGGDSFRKGYDLLAPIGHLIMYGMVGFCPPAPRPSFWRLALEYFRQPRFSPMQMIPDNKTISGFNLVHLFEEPTVMSRMFPQLLELLASGKLRVHVDRAFDYREAGAAQEHLRSRASVGKVVLTCPDQ
jgi:NADPH:quinone reductase-like Zn-dependent oxidoreductase